MSSPVSAANSSQKRTQQSSRGLESSFYALSKTHHPDHNPSDPHAPRRFMRISEAYTVLSHAEKRAAYDRDVLRLHHHHHPPPTPRVLPQHQLHQPGGRPSGLGPQPPPRNVPRPAPELLPQRGMGRARREAAGRAPGEHGQWGRRRRRGRHGPRTAPVRPPQRSPAL